MNINRLTYLLRIMYGHTKKKLIIIIYKEKSGGMSNFIKNIYT